ncbi:MAG: hypothetical protein ACN4GG_07050 [Akkermansiaceae bacterium]
MQRRKTRKGYWWWSWLLIIFIGGGAVGGWFFGEKYWENVPKQYRATAKLRAFVIPDYLGSGTQRGIAGVRGGTAGEVLQDLESVEFLTSFAKDEVMNLERRWGLTLPDVIKELRQAIFLDYTKDKELYITIERNSPEEAEEIANYLSILALERLDFLNGKLRKAGMSGVDSRISLYIDAVQDTHAEYAAILRAKSGVDIDPKPEMDLNDYNTLGDDVIEAQVYWKEALDDLKDARREFMSEISHWEQKVLPSSVLEKAELPTEIYGPQIEPYRTRGAIGGLSLGICLGLFSMLICWKLFS